jgi:hypothetical protein
MLFIIGRRLYEQTRCQIAYRRDMYFAKRVACEEHSCTNCIMVINIRNTVSNSCYFSEVGCPS